MELRSGRHLYFIRTIKSGLVTKVVNVSRGQPAPSFKMLADIKDPVKAQPSCIDTKRKRKCSQGLDSSATKMKLEVLTSEDDSRKEQMSGDDLDLMETLGGLRSKLSKSLRKSKNQKCINDPISVNALQIIPFVKSEEIQNDQDQEFPPPIGDSAALVEVNETDFLNGSDDYFRIVAKEDAENKFNHEWNEYSDFVPLRMAWPSNSSMDIVVYEKELINDQPSNVHAIEFISLVEDDCSRIVVKEDAENKFNLVWNEFYDEWRKHIDFIPLQLPFSTTMHIVIHETELISDRSPNFPAIEFVNEDHISETPMNLLDNDTGHNKDDKTVIAEVQGKPCSAIEHSLSPVGCGEYEEKQSFASVDDDEKRNVIEASTDEFRSLDEQKVSDKLRPKRLLSKRKAISPTTQKMVREAMESFDSNHDKNSIKCRGKLCLDDHIDKNNGAADGLRPRFTPKTLRRGSSPKSILKIPHSSRPANCPGYSSLQCCSKSAITFSRKQMLDVECLVKTLGKELNSMKDILDDMLRSEFCLKTSLRYKVNEAMITVKNATKAEDAAKRGLSVMARKCDRFCKIMQTLANEDPPAQQDVVRKERRKIVFADEAGGSLCQVRFYEREC